jgi:hypothetical protein
MTMQQSLFSAWNLASTVQIPKAPALVPHKWPFPGMTPEDSARAGIANSEEYRDMLAAVIKSQGGAEMTAKQIMALVPADWREVCREYAFCNLDFRCGEQRGIQVKYVPHDGGGFHFTYQAIDQEKR